MKRKISIDQFESLVRNRGMVPVTRQEHKDLTIFVSDGYSEKKGVYVTWYAVGTPERVDLAQILEFDKYEDKNGLKVPSKRKWRVKKALETAKKMIPNIKRTPIYAQG